MAHALRYYKEITHADGKVIRIEFHEKDGTEAAMELGDVIQSLNLEIQGGDDIDAPIVKTQLNFTLVDAPDHQDRKTKKCGAWEEFYSPDATHWKVLVFADGVQMWGGYITPDSYHETLTYRSSVSFIARDNLGHLNDYPFDATGNAEGMISMYDLVQTAWRKIESPMQLTTDSTTWLKCEDTSGISTYMNVSAFEGKNWYEVLESALYAYGLVMRYVGENKIAVYPLREMPFYGKESIGSINVQFEAGAERELSPAARRIEEVVKYEIQEDIERPLVKAIEYTGASVDVTIEGKNVFGETTTATAKTNPLTKKSGLGWYNPNRDASLLLNPTSYNTEQVKDFIASDMLFLLNTKNTEVVYSAAIVPQNITIRLAFGTAVEILSANLTPKWFAELSQIKYAISATQNGVTQYWDGSTWKSAKTELTATFEKAEVVLNCNARSFSGEITLNLHIYSVGYKSSLSSEDAAYACLNSFSFASAESPALLTTNRVNTNYIDTNNVILSREPQLAPAMNTPFVPAFIKNGIFRKVGDSYVAAYKWSWNGSGAQQMAVYNHLQLLCFYGKPNNILSGTIVNGNVSDFAKIYKWNNTEHIITSGVLNLISGFIENAQLREFVHYDTMWGDLTDAADFPQVDGGSKTTAESGTQSAQTATYSNTTEVNIGGGGGTMVLDTYMSDSSTNGVQNKVIKAYVDSAVNAIDKELDGLETSLATKAKQSDLVITNENVAANATAIADRYTKAQVNTIVKTLTDADTATNTRVKSLEDWKAVMDLFSSKFYLKDGDIYCDTNLIVSGDAATGGSGDPSTNQGIDETKLAEYLNEYKYVNEDRLNEYGFATENYVNNAITNLNISQYVKTSELGALATKDSLTYSDVGVTKDVITLLIGTTTYAPYNANGYLPLNGGTIKGDIFLKKDDWYQGAYTAIFRNASASADYGTQIINSWNGGETRLILSKDDISFRKDGINNTLIHSGNIGSQSVASAKKLVTSAGADAVVVNSSGNVGIGTSSPSNKLDVLGSIRAYANDTSVRHVYASNSAGSVSLYVATSGNRGILDVTNSKWVMYTNGTDTYISSYPLTIEKAVTMSSTLGVSGQATFESDIYVKGESAVGSDIRFKDIAEHKTLSLDTMANAPLFSFTWNDREDKALHLGTSAQYWEEAIPELVSGSDFKTLNYASLGVAMGISLAQEVKDLKAEVKRLKKEIDGIRNR